MNGLTKDGAIEALESIARLLELKGENPFKIRAYTQAARAIETFAGDLAAKAEEGTLHEIEGIGKAIGEKLSLLHREGRLEYLEALRAEFPEGIFELFELQGLGGKKIKALFDHLGVGSVAELEAACKDGRVEALAGFGKKSAANFLKAIEDRAKHAGSFRFGDVAPEALGILEDLRSLPETSQAAIAGSYRRRKEIVRDLDFIVATRSPETVADFFVSHPAVESVMAKGETKCSARLKSGIQADLRAVTNDQFPFALAYFTGSKEHNIAVRARAQERGWTLNEYRLAQDPSPKAGVEPAGEPPAIRTEEDLHRALGLAYIEPELRENLGEIAAAEAGTLPDLVELTNLRGTFHNHTVASDGRDTLEQMAAAARDLGLEYLGIADHSQSSFQAHGLDAGRLLAQVEEIRALNGAFDDFRVFAGVECDILKDGSLDFPDEILARLDYVVASVHSAFTLPEAEMTARIIRAVENPYVTMLGHITGRILLGREGYAVNIPAVIEACAATGTAIELNANPWRLELDWRWWPLAKEKGVRCCINPDAHAAAALQNLYYGIGIARKGWLERRDVLNCLPLAQVERELARKRGG